MAKFVKPKELFAKNATIEIQPLTKDSVETFSIWDNVEKKFYNANDDLTIDGVTKKVDGNNSWKFTKLTAEQKERYARNPKFNRDVILNGEEVTFPMPKTVDDALKAHMDTIEKMGQNPLAFTYTVTKEGTGLNTKYTVAVGKPKQYVASKNPEPELDLDEGVVEPTETEMRYIEAIKKKYSDYASKNKDTLADVFVTKLGTTKDRAKALVEQYLSA